MKKTRITAKQPYVIESGIPLPSTLASIFRKLRPGQSFFVPLKNGEDPHLRQQRLATRAWQLKAGRFATRQVPGGIRVWKVA